VQKRVDRPVSRRRRLLSASWFTAAGEGSWLSREQVRFVEQTADNPKPKTAP
jgi:hypothetical protein